MTEIQNSKQKNRSLKCLVTCREPHGRTIGICNFDIVCNLSIVIRNFTAVSVPDRASDLTIALAIHNKEWFTLYLGNNND